MWLSLVHMLQKKDKLPMVAFTFSRARCDGNADSLSSLDLTTSTEKSEIHVFFKRSITLLKGTDQRLPQVLNECVWSSVACECIVYSGTPLLGPLKCGHLRVEPPD